jgi:hypothetical protein
MIILPTLAGLEGLHALHVKSKALATELWQYIITVVQPDGKLMKHYSVTRSAKF